MVIALGDLFALESIHFRIKGGIKTLASAAKQSQSSSIPEREQRLWSPVEPSYCFPTGQNSPVLAPVICPAFLFLFSRTFLYFNKISVLVTVGEICKSRELPYLIQGIRCSPNLTLPQGLIHEPFAELNKGSLLPDPHNTEDMLDPVFLSFLGCGCRHLCGEAEDDLCYSGVPQEPSTLFCKQNLSLGLRTGRVG